MRKICNCKTQESKTRDDTGLEIAFIKKNPMFGRKYIRGLKNRNQDDILNAEISNDENKKVNFSHEKNMTEQKNATLVQVNILSNHNSNLAYIIRFYY